MSRKTILVIAFLFWAGLASLSLLGATLPSPQPWLIDWTAWVASAAGIVVGARALWEGANWIRWRIHGELR